MKWPNPKWPELLGRLRMVSRAPVVSLGFVLVAQWMGGVFSDQVELLWLNKLLVFRAAEYLEPGTGDTLPKLRHSSWGFARPLDERIRFVEIENDDYFVEQIRQHGEYGLAVRLLDNLSQLHPRVVVLDILFTLGDASEQEKLAEQIRRIEAKGQTKVVLALEIYQDEIARSLPSIDNESFRMGFVNVSIDTDRLWRTYHPTRIHNQKTIPSLALAAFDASMAIPVQLGDVEEATDLVEKASHSELGLKMGQASWPRLNPRGKVETVTLDDKPIVLNLQHSYYNDSYDEEAGLARRVWTAKSIDDLVHQAPTNSLSQFQDAIVFVGYGADVDGKPTSHGGMEPGMNLHATALHDFCHGTYLRPFKPWQRIAALVATALLASIFFGLVPGKKRLLLGAMTVKPLILAIGAAMVWFGYLIPPTMAVISLWSLAYVGELYRRWTDEQKARIQRDAMLGFYFSPAVLRQVSQNDEMIQPRAGQMAALISDMRGFTSLCETLEPDQIFRLLNRLFEIETTAALKENGSLRPFAGDQFLAYWGAPEPCDQPADRALRAALEIVGKIRQRQVAPDRDELDALIRIGIGLHYGRAVVGHIGSRQFRDYNVMGDLINATARMESQTKHYQAQILASTEFLQALSIDVKSTLLDEVRLKGREAPIALHTIWSDKCDVREEFVEAFQAVFRLYRQGEFTSAAHGFQSLIDCSITTLAATSRRLETRCRELAKRPPADWDGVYELTEK
jgi:class 3 adenylate cyclase/CHASE2 domain-containing sensor protein